MANIVKAACKDRQVDLVVHLGTNDLSLNNLLSLQKEISQFWPEAGQNNRFTGQYLFSPTLSKP